MRKKEQIGEDTMDTKCAYVPPVILEQYEDFEEYAKEAAIVTFSTEYFQTPFKSDEKYLRRVTLSAVGVKMENIPLTFTHVIDYTAFSDGSHDWEGQIQRTDQVLSDILDKLQSKCNLVRGSIEGHSTLGEALFARP